MKKSMLNFLFFIFIAFPGKAGNTDYAINMQQAKTMTDTATIENTLVIAANYFERIAANEH